MNSFGIFMINYEVLSYMVGDILPTYGLNIKLPSQYHVILSCN
jgi:hypothetical protein